MCDPRLRKSVCQSLSALCTTSLQNVSAVSSLHSLSETVLLLSLTLFRLISSKHVWHLLADSYRKRIVHSRHFRFYTMTSYIINTKCLNCQVFFENFKRFFVFFSSYISSERISAPSSGKCLMVLCHKTTKNTTLATIDISSAMGNAHQMVSSPPPKLASRYAAGSSTTS